jgi:hypothetical protein
MTKKSDGPNIKFERDSEKEIERRREARKQSALERLGSQDPRCRICCEADPRTLENHHLGGRHFDPKSLVFVCRNCHRKLSDLQKDHPQKLTEIPDPIEVIAHFLLGLADFLEFVIQKLREFARQLIDHLDDPHTHQEPAK